MKLFNFIIYVNSFKISIHKICQTMIFDCSSVFKLFFLNYLYSINEESELRTNESVACVSRVQMQPNIFPGTDLTQLRNIVKGTACRGAESTTDLDMQMFFT